MALSDPFLKAVDETLRDALSKWDGLEAMLEDTIGAAREAWPDVKLDRDEFLAYFAARVPTDRKSATAAAESVRTNDLYLSCACAAGNEKALGIFEDRYMPDVVVAVARMDPSGTLGEDVTSQLRSKLLTAHGDKPPGIAQYAGRGDLHSWLRVVAVRDAISVLRKKKKEVLIDDDAFLDDALMAAPVPEDDQEIAYLKEKYRAEFKVAFREALTSLDARDRTLLRYHYLDGLNIDQIGALYKVHRATVARWLAKTRVNILAGTRTSLMNRLNVSKTEFESIVRLIESQLDVSIQGMLVTTDGRADEDKDEDKPGDRGGGEK